MQDHQEQPTTRTGTEAPRVFIRPEVLRIPPSRGPGSLDTGGRIAPDAQQALDMLHSIGYRAIVAGHDEPLAISSGDWLLTGHPEDCRVARRAGARSVLVGTNTDLPAHWSERCDVLAGSAFQAVIEVVASAEQMDEGAVNMQLPTRP